MTPAQILGLDAEAAADPTAVKRAYARLLKQHRPDKDPEGFRRIRDAYEALIQGRSIEPLADDGRMRETEAPALELQYAWNPSLQAPQEEMSWQARLSQALAADALTVEVGPLLSVVQSCHHELSVAESHWRIRVAMHLALRAPELALDLIRDLPPRDLYESHGLDLRIEFARHMCKVPEGQRPAVAAVVDAGDDEVVGEGSIRMARQVLYALPFRSVLGDAIRMRLNVVDQERIQLAEQSFNRRHQEEMDRIRRRRGLAFDLSGWFMDLSGKVKALFLLILAALVLAANMASTARTPPQPTWSPEEAARIFDEIQRRQVEIRRQRLERESRAAQAAQAPPLPVLPQLEIGVSVSPVRVLPPPGGDNPAEPDDASAPQTAVSEAERQTKNN